MLNFVVPVAISYDQYSDEERSRLLELFADRDAESQESHVMRREVQSLVHDAISKLPRRERAIIRQRFGLDDDRPRTLQQVSRRLELSRERVRQLEIAALQKLREHLGNARPDLMLAGC